MPRKITSLRGKTITQIACNGSYYTLWLASKNGRAAGVVTIHIDNIFDGDGMRLEDATK